MTSSSSFVLPRATRMNFEGLNFARLDRTYRITPIQQPERGAAFRNYLSRLSLAPPLILQFDCWDANGELTIPYDELPFLVCHLTLQTPDGEDAQMVYSPEGEIVSMLYGTLIASPTEMDDQTGAPGVYFVYPDVSIRYVGRFRIKAYVMRIIGGPALNTCYTEPFDVVSDTEFVAPAVTELTRHFDSQGIVRFNLPSTSTV